MATVVLQAGNYKNVTGTGQVTSVGGNLIGFYVNSTSSGTIVLKDGTATAGTAISGTITPAVGWHAFPATYGTSGLYVTIANTLNVTLIYQPAAGA